MSFHGRWAMGKTALASKMAAFALGALIVTSSQSRGQGPVSGQVSISERPGESTEDLGNTVIYLDSPTSARAKLESTTDRMALQSRQFSPHVRIVPQGSKIDFWNQDPFSHNV